METRLGGSILAAERWLGWHMGPANRRLYHRDDIAIEAGLVVRARGAIALCQSGPHASKRAIDALQYSQGSLVSRVHLSGQILHDTRQERGRGPDSALDRQPPRQIGAIAEAVHYVRAGGLDACQLAQISECSSGYVRIEHLKGRLAGYEVRYGVLPTQSRP